VIASLDPTNRQALQQLGQTLPNLNLLVLHGSRARGTAHARSDWDLAYEAEPGFDPDRLLAALADTLKADRIDLVDLDRAGALLRHRVASDAMVLFERSPGRFDRFWHSAVRNWCELAPVLEPIYERALQARPS
jgi:predicted nucleotidyltransferase